ncbi:hypothetical protein [Terrarubrum flagellatum]|uniref:hypothetical protein n=1 Tax=Terrirubrum flagellatum TaxID=2895980 RepID=UPI003144D736
MSVLSSITLRQALALDAIASGGMAALLLAGADLLEGWLGIPAGFQRGAAAVLVPYVAFVAWLAIRPEPQRSLAWCAVAINALWVVESLLVLMTGWFQPTALGVAFVVGQAAIVAILAELQIMALRRRAAIA